MKTLIQLIVLLLVLCAGCSTEAERLKPFEQAYFEGQRDALNDDVRIRWDAENRCWRWVKTCWDSGTPTTFDPSVSDDTGANR
jgi:hypothetical protein